MLTKRTQVAVNADALKKVKEKFGEFLAMGKLIGSLLDDVADGNLTYLDGHRQSSKTIINVPSNIGTAVASFVQPEPEEAKPVDVVDTRPERAKDSTFIYEGYPWDIYKAEEDLIDDLMFTYQKPMEETGKFNEDLYESIFKMKFGKNRFIDDGYTADVDISIPSLYNYFRLNNLPKAAEKVESIVYQAKRWYDQEGPKSLKKKK